MTLKTSYTGSVLYFVGLLSLYLGERIVGSDASRMIFSWLGVAWVVAAVVMRLGRAVQAPADRKSVEQAFLILYLVGALAIAFYAVQSDLWVKVADKALKQTSPKLAVVLAALWPALMTTSVLSVIFGEISYASMARAAVVEKGRVQDAIRSGLGTAAALVFAFCVAYVAQERDQRWDFSYFRTAKPGEATRKVVAALTEPLEVTLFYPPANEVGENVKEYFTDLATSSPLLKVSFLDQALEPAKARDLGVPSNGIVVIARGGRREHLNIGTDQEKARGQLRNLDRDAQSKLMQVSRKQRVVYLTSGHEERGKSPMNPMDARATVRKLRDLLASQNYDVRDLSAVEGLAVDVPQDASAVLILGPQRAFMTEEIAALNRYLDAGGRVLLALEPEAKLDFADLLRGFGLKYNTTMLANDRVHIRETGRSSDRTLLLTAAFSSHPSVTTLGQLSGRAPLALIGSGYFENVGERPAGVSGDTAVRSHPETFPDKNGNFEPDPDEARGEWTLMWAGTRRNPQKPSEQEGRFIALADSEAMSDSVLQNMGNAYLTLDAVKWVVGDDALFGGTTSEADIPIQHTRKQDLAWFYSTIFVVPALIMGLGFLVTRGRGGRRKAAPVVAPVEVTQ